MIRQYVLHNRFDFCEVYHDLARGNSGTIESSLILLKTYIIVHFFLSLELFCCCLGVISGETLNFFYRLKSSV